MPIPDNYDLIKRARPISNILAQDIFPSAMFASPCDGGDLQPNSVLESVYYTDYRYTIGENFISVSIDMLVPADLEISLFGLDHISFGIGEEGFVPFTLRVVWTNDDLAILLENIKVGVRFSRDLLLPVVDTNGRFEVIPEEPPQEGKPSGPRVSLFTTGSLYLDKAFDFEVTGFDAVDLSPCKLPGLDMYLSLKGVKLSLSKKDPIEEVKNLGFPSDFQGIFISQALIHFQDDLKFLPPISAENLAIGTGGISGKITATFDLAYDEGAKTFVGDAAGKLFGDDGVAIGLRKFELELRANEVVSSEITGQMLFPFFEKPVEIELSLDLKGNFAIGVRGTQGDVLVELTKEDLLSMKINSFAFSKQDQEIAFFVGGRIKPLFGGDVEIPEFGVNALIVSRDLEDKKWRARIEGGWIAFPEEISFTAAGFRGGLRKLGWGTIDVNGTKNEFIGFSGSLSFVSGFALAAEFDDLMLFYSPNVRVELTRARLGLLIPDAVSLIGEVSKKGDGFGGMIDVTIIPTELRIMGGAEFGRTKPPQDIFEYMQIMMALELPPPGIQLGSTPLAIRGFEGKHALNMTASMDPGWEWAIAPPRGITPLSKMVPHKGGKMLGAGLKIASTDGTLVVINALLALMLPGPVVLIEGRGAILTKASDQSSPADPPFYALVVINGKEKYFSANLSYNADLAKGIIKVNGTVEMFFDFERPSNWHIYMGQAEPKSKRIQGVAFKVLKAQTYFEMYDGPHILTGAYVGVNERKNFKVGHAVVKAHIEGGTDLSWKPEHAAGFLAFVAEITVRACGFGAGLGASGEVDAKCPYPRRLHLEVEYRFSFNLPWPVPDVKIRGKFEKTWKDGQKYPCAFEPLVREVLVDSEMPGIPAKTLDRFDSADGPDALADVPLVSLDARPTLRFAYPMNDETPEELPLAGNASNGPILHRIGDDEYKFSLVSVTLERYALPEDPAQFNNALNSQFNPNAVQWETVEIPYGVWVADNSMTGHSAATILRVFSATPFTHFRQSMFFGGLISYYQIGLASSIAAWLATMSGDSGLYSADTFVAQIETGAPATAANLSATVQDQAPNYPLGVPEAEWRYLGFADIPLQYRQRHIDVTNSVGVSAAPDPDGTVRPFDVIDLYFLPPAAVMPDVHNVPTLVRGVYFEGTIQVRFSVPVSECELYMYPVTRRSATWDHYPEDWPEEGRPGRYRPDVDRAFSEECCRKAQAFLKRLTPFVKGEKAEVHLNELAAVIEKCCEPQPKEEPRSSEPFFPKDCCDKALELLKELASAIAGQEAGALIKELAVVVEACCKEEQKEGCGEREAFSKECCEKTRGLLKELAATVDQDKARALLKELAAVIEDCCTPQKQGEKNDLRGKFLRDCCDKALALLEQLASVIQGQKAQALVRDLARVFQECCERAQRREPDERAPFQESCCEEVYAHLKGLSAMLEDEEEAQSLLKGLAAVIDECCGRAKPKEEPRTGERSPVSADVGLEEATDHGIFLTFDFVPTPDVLHKYPPRISARRRQNGYSDIVPHIETKGIVDNLYRVHVRAEGTPFDEIRMGNTLSDEDLFLVAISYLPDVDESYDLAKDKIAKVNDLAWSGDGDMPVVLSERSCYRLTVQTAADCDNNAPRTHVYYFRTDGPPAKAIKHYIAWTVPAPQGYPLFRSYDVSIRFRTNYVDQFFEDLPLRLHLKSDSGRVKIAEIGVDLSWQDEAKHLLRPEEQAYIDVLNASAMQIDPNAIPGDKSLVMAGASSSGSPLEPDQAYSAALTLSPESNFHVALANVVGTSYYFTQALATMVTAQLNPGEVVVGNQMLLGSSEDFRNIEVAIASESVLYEFSFRTSRFLNFADMFSNLVDGEAAVQSTAAPNVSALRTALEALSNICDQVWRPAQLALWEKQLLIQQRLAKDEELLDLLDNRANANQQLDQAFGSAIEKLPELAGLLLQPRPRRAQVYFSGPCILVDLPEPVEFARICVTYDAFDVLIACSSDESRWLIFPVDGSCQFSPSGTLTVNYHLDIGDDYPRLRYGSLIAEHVQISLGLV